MNDTTASVSHEEFDELRDALVAVADQRDLIRKRLRETIAEWREMGAEKIVADTAANVIEQDLLTPVVTPPFERMNPASPREIERALRLMGWDSGPIDAQSVLVAAVNGVLALRRSDPTQAAANAHLARAPHSLAPEGIDADLVGRAEVAVKNGSGFVWVPARLILALHRMAPRTPPEGLDVDYREAWIAARAVVRAARAVCGRSEFGDLSGAVRELDAAVTAYDQRNHDRAAAPPPPAEGKKQ